MGRDISRLRTDTFRLDTLASRFEKNKLIIDLEDRAGHLVETLEVLLKARKGRAGDETPQIKQSLEKLIEIKRVIDRHKIESSKQKVRKSMPTFKSFMQGRREQAVSQLADKRAPQPERAASKRSAAVYQSGSRRRRRSRSSKAARPRPTVEEAEAEALSRIEHAKDEKEREDARLKTIEQRLDELDTEFASAPGSAQPKSNAVQDLLQLSEEATLQA